MITAARHFVIFLAALGAACSTLRDDGSLGVDSSGGRVRPIIPNRSLQISKSLSVPLEGLALGVAVYLVVDPLGPNWRIEETRLAENLFRITLRRKPFATGGDGEAVRVFQRRAENIARDHGYAGYTILEYAEVIESILPAAQRVSFGVIQLK